VLLFRNDFGGNETGHLPIPDICPSLYRIDLRNADCDGFSNILGFEYNYDEYNYQRQDSLQFTFTKTGDKGFIRNPGDPNYKGSVPRSAWYRLDDHTSPGDQTVGYFLEMHDRLSPNSNLVFGGADGGQNGDNRTTLVKDLCPGTEIYVAYWVANAEKDPINPIRIRQRMEVRDGSSQYSFQEAPLLGYIVTGDVPQDSLWHQYGFSMTVPPDVTSLQIAIYNLSTGATVYGIDDIEVFLCSLPPATAASIAASDTTVCLGNSLSLVGEYTDVSCAFGDDLRYGWDFRHRDSVNWVALNSDQTSIHCRDGKKTTLPLTITNASKADEGWYRMTVQSYASRLSGANCRTSSDSIYVRIGASVAAPDIRVQVCPSPNGQVRLSSFLDSTIYSNITWEALSGSPPVDESTGLITGAFAARATYTYRYSAGVDTESCTTAKVYVRTLHDRILTKLDTVVICHSMDNSTAIQLNQIFGLELGGSWDYSLNPDQTVADNIRTFSPASKYAGAQIFNARNAYNTADPQFYPDYTYRGYTGKKFEFLYQGNCIGNKKIVMIVY
jgi:hypothetical protein